MVFVPGGKLLATSDNLSVSFWDLRTGRLARKIEDDDGLISARIQREYPGFASLPMKAVWRLERTARSTYGIG
jgi:hypothetical protein